MFKAWSTAELFRHAAGLDLQETSKKLSTVSASLEERELALAEYKARAKQLELIKARDLHPVTLDEAFGTSRGTG